MKQLIPFLLIFITSAFLVSSCDKDEDGGAGGNGGGTSATKITISSIAKFEGNENSTFDFKVRLSQASSDDVTVNFTTKDKSAVSVEDYISQSGSLTFSGTTEQIISVEIVADTLKEGDEEFEVQLSSPTNATLENESAIGTIRNDDTFLPGGGDGYITPNSYPGMTLVWTDEFNEANINLGNWTHETGNGSGGWGNNELQYYTSSSENSYISDGKLIIEAKEQNVSGSNYTSARMISAGKREFIYGRVDVRAKLPEGQGIWPAVWMLGADIFTDGWPACGEIDIMELVGHEPNKANGTAHWGNQGNPSTYQGNAFTLPAGEKYSDEFHVFSIIWENNSIKWLMDDQQFFSITDGNVTNTAYPFNDNFFFILNVAVGGNWPGSPDASTVFPQRMFVDYVRIFQ
ncbi:MAG: beta-glucanase (GH16 family) [Granulosicoccus sp.]|jgi:beta-glucanase (GH16 family)